jgi:hypothetical protein
MLGVHAAAVLLQIDADPRDVYQVLIDPRELLGGCGQRCC